MNLTLIESAWPGESVRRDVLLVLAGSVLTALSAQVAIPLPFSPVPVTGQTFAVLLVGAVLGSRLGAWSMLAYLVEGAAGLPVFAGGHGTLLWMIGPTGGYLAGFVVAAYATGWLCERGWDRRLPTALVAMLIGNVLIYALGLPWLAHFVGASKVVALGLAPFIVGDAAKIVLAGLTLPAAWKLVR
jgi:biotin transport system substrate-specific component